MTFCNLDRLQHKNRCSISPTADTGEASEPLPCFFFALILSLALEKERAYGGASQGGCQTVTTAGTLSATSISNLFTFASSGGGYIVFEVGGTVNIRHRDYPNFEIQFWGGQKYHTFDHENLNGKHIKDWLGDRRTILFPDGAKMTLVVAGTGQDRRAVSLTIYDGPQVHRFDLQTGALEFSSDSSADLARSTCTFA